MSWRVNGNIVTEGEYNEASRAGKSHCEKPWSDIGYHLGIERDGGNLVVRIGRPWNKSGAHAGFKQTNKYNESYLGCCVIGNYDVLAPDADTIELMLAVTRQLMERFDIPKEDVLGHRETYDQVGVPRLKTCPGTAIDMELFRGKL
jgi:N-acetyl-anhydromuramyl-L-alanine amidase AmpD